MNILPKNYHDPSLVQNTQRRQLSHSLLFAAFLVTVHEVLFWQILLCLKKLFQAKSWKPTIYFSTGLRGCLLSDLLSRASIVLFSKTKKSMLKNKFFISADAIYVLYPITALNYPDVGIDHFNLPHSIDSANHVCNSLHLLLFQAPRGCKNR